MMSFVRESDVLYITKFDRLARSVIDLRNIAKFLQNKDINLKVLHQNIDTTYPAGRLLFTILDAIAEFERDLINEHVREGIKAAKKVFSLVEKLFWVIREKIYTQSVRESKVC